MKISQIGELALLEKIRHRFRTKQRNILLGIGDDAAVVKPSSNKLLFTTDMMVEGVHFDLSLISPSQLGFKLVSVNVSDIYAMGGSPLYMLLNLSAPKSTTVRFIDDLLQGIREALRHYSCSLIGGDISASSHNMISLSATLIGTVRKPLLRSGADIGDRIYVTGNLGDSSCGLAVLKRIGRQVSFLQSGSSVRVRRPASNLLPKLPWKVIEPLLRRHLLPEPRAPKGYAPHATAMIDISDGLLIDLSRLCDESNVGAKVYLDKIPLSPELKKTARHFRKSPISFALRGGEDYELLFTAPQGKKVNARYIGDIVRSERTLVNRSGGEKPFLAEGYQHFS
jgi:thiamine-monophosphate kinase